MRLHCGTVRGLRLTAYKRCFAQERICRSAVSMKDILEELVLRCGHPGNVTSPSMFLVFVVRSAFTLLIVRRSSLFNVVVLCHLPLLVFFSAI